MIQKVWIISWTATDFLYDVRISEIFSFPPRKNVISSIKLINQENLVTDTFQALRHTSVRQNRAAKD